MNSSSFHVEVWGSGLGLIFIKIQQKSNVDLSRNLHRYDSTELTEVWMLFEFTVSEFLDIQHQLPSIRHLFGESNVLKQFDRIR